MALARVVAFENVNEDNVARIRQGIESGDVPEGMPAAEFLLLHDPSADQALAVVIVETEDDYRRVDEILGGMPSDDAPRCRSTSSQRARPPAEAAGSPHLL
jgi:hypothetical protein